MEGPEIVLSCFKNEATTLRFVGPPGAIAREWGFPGFEALVSVSSVGNWFALGFQDAPLPGSREPSLRSHLSLLKTGAKHGAGRFHQQFSTLERFWTGVPCSALCLGETQSRHAI
jgi:hypothetical protein